MRKLALLLLVTIFTVTCASDGAAARREPLLVSPEWLARHLGDPDLVLLHVGKKDAYAAEHLPGARHVAQADVSLVEDTESGLHLQMLPAEELQRRLQKLGISDRSRIVVYYAGQWVTPATRIVFTLHYAGLGDRTSLLDGGLAVWKRAGYPVTAQIPEPREGRLRQLALQTSVVDASWVRANAHKRGFVLVDARLPAYFDGVDRGGTAEAPHKVGHIAGACNISFQRLTTDDGFLPPSELRRIFETAGVKRGDTVVGYCHNGQQATAVLFAARLLGHDVLLYDGSFEEWSKEGVAAAGLAPRSSR